MSEPQQLRAPDHVPDALVRMYGPEAAGHRVAGRAQRAVGQAVIGRAERWLLGTSMACCIAVVVAILIALVAVTPAPTVAVAGLLAVLLVAAVAARVIVRAGQREEPDERVEDFRMKPARREHN